MNGTGTLTSLTPTLQRSQELGWPSLLIDPLKDESPPLAKSVPRKGFPRRFPF